MAGNVVRVADEEAQDARRARILDAAERCIARSGFHRTTMQDVAAEAGMSPGNLYRYFRSKDAIVAGLAERDRAEFAADFSGFEEGSDLIQGFLALARKHFEHAPREKAILCLEIWAEATRNPVFAGISAEFEREVTGRLTDLFRVAQARGTIAPGVDPALLAVLVSTLANGVFIRRAVASDFSADREVAIVMATIDAAFQGRIALPAGRPQGDLASEAAALEIAR